MVKLLFAITIWFSLNKILAQGTDSKIDIYFIPGMGIDSRVFNHFSIDTAIINPVFIKWTDYSGSSTLNEYAEKLVVQFDNTRQFIIVGVSMGGMIALELQGFLNPEAIILISSVKCSEEITSYYKIGRYLPFHKLMGERSFNYISSRKIVYNSIIRKEDQALYQKMISDTGHEFLEWQMNAIVNWEYDCCKNKSVIYHIHGDSDKVLPVKKVTADIIIEKGTHKLVINYPEFLSGIINEIAGSCY